MGLISKLFGGGKSSPDDADAQKVMDFDMMHPLDRHRLVKDLFIEMSNTMGLLADDRETIWLANRAFCEAFEYIYEGQGKSELEGDSLRIFIPADRWQAHSAAFQQHLKEPMNARLGPVKALKKTGEPIWIMIRPGQVIEVGNRTLTCISITAVEVDDDGDATA